MVKILKSFNLSKLIDIVNKLRNKDWKIDDSTEYVKKTWWGGYKLKMIKNE